ncbi:MAG: archaellin/type IV pilin N-terminal domain-containing protein [Methanolinea sp.]|jgi:flagellin FlaB
MRSFKLNDNGFTGLEAAIVLIAFVVVAAVFSYVVLGAGFFTTQKAQETVYEASGQATSSFEVVGQVYGIATSQKTAIDYIRFNIGNTAGGGQMDITKMAVTYVDETTRQDLKFTSAEGTSLDGALASSWSKWGIRERINANSGNLLEKGEQFVLEAGTPTSAKLNARITLNLLPSKGAPNALHRSIPAGLNTINILF